MHNLTEDQKLKILLGIIGVVILSIIIYLLIGFENDNNKRQEKIGFVVLCDINESGWSASHYNGIKSACDKFGIELLVRDKVKENSGQCAIAVSELISQGAGLIILASFNYSSEIRDLIDKHSNIIFVDISTQKNAKNLTTCIARMYQGRYLAGALAGMKTKSNVIGYVAAMPNSEVCRGINAFTLGLQRVNSDAKVIVTWTGDWENYDVESKNAKRLIEECNADILTYHQDDSTVAEVAESYGINYISYNDLIEGHSEICLTSIICRWDLFYSEVVQKYLKGEIHLIRTHWLGIQQGIITLSDYSDLVTPSMRSNLHSLQRDLIYNRLIFSNEIYDNQGNLRCSNGESITDEELLKNINWLVKGVEVLE